MHIINFINNKSIIIILLFFLMCSFLYFTFIHDNKSILINADYHDFGVIYPNEKYNHIFTIKNISKKRIENLTVRSSCGCISSKLNKDVIDVSEEVMLEVILKANQSVGPQEELLKIISNNNRLLGEIKLSGVVKKLWELYPNKYVLFDEIVKNDKKEKIVKLKNLAHEEFEILGVNNKNPNIKIIFGEIEENAIPLRIICNADCEEGHIHETIEIITDSDKQKIVNLYVYTKIVGLFKLDNENLFFGTLNWGETCCKNLRIYCTGNSDISGYEFNLLKSDSVKLKGIEKNNKFVEFKIEYNADDEIGYNYGNFIINAIQDEEIEITVPYSANVIGEKRF